LAGSADKELSSIFEGKVTLLSGNSGVGKSTLLNAILGSDIARTGAISSAHHKGMHTTTFSEMYPLPDANAWIIDTPGIKGFGLLDIQKEEVGHYFREIFEVSRECRYSNCIHMNEPGCAVNQAVMEGRIALSRYESYLSILDDTTEGKYR
jgi:ribosome biogenesis GTPase